TLRNAVISERDTRIVVLDLSEVEAIDAGGLTALVSLHHWTRGRGIQLKLVNPSRFVMETLQRTGLMRFSRSPLCTMRWWCWEEFRSGRFTMRRASRPQGLKPVSWQSVGTA